MTQHSFKEQPIFAMPPNSEAYSLAAYIAHPYLDIPDNLTEERIPVFEVQRVLLANKVLFRSFVQYDFLPDSRKKDAIFNLISNSKEMSKSYDFCKVLKNDLLDAVRHLNDSNLQMLFIKSSNTLPLDSDNFDLLIRDDQIKLADDVLHRNGFSLVRAAVEPDKVLYRKTKNGKDFLALHLHSKIGWGGVEFLKAHDVWQKYLTKQIDATNVSFIHPEHHVLVTLAHAFFENAALKLGDILYLVDSFSSNSFDIESMISSSKALKWDTVFCAMLQYANSLHCDIYGLPIIQEDKLESALLKALSQEKREKVKSLYGKMKVACREPYLPVVIPLRGFRGRQLISQVVFNDSLSLTSKLKKIMHLLSVFLSGTVPKRRPPIVVSFIGEDSTGKTTHARGIVDAFRRRGYDAAYFWSRGAFRISAPIVNLATSLLSSRSNIKSSEKSSETRVRQVKSNLFFGKALALLVVFEHGAQLKSKLLLKRFSTNAVVFDRYLHDTVVDSLFNYGQDYSSLFSRLLLNKVGLFASEPDLIVLFRASPHAIIKRRPDEDFEEVKLKSRIYEQWSRQWGAYVLDTERHTIEQNQLNLLEKALKLFYEGRTD